jgi:ABC-type transport system involved in cytochrome c biogenesis permease subunit
MATRSGFSDLPLPRGEGFETTAAMSNMRYAARRVLAVWASLRLTVVLFALTILLVFAGTLAQKDHDVWYVVYDAYFRVWFARIEWRTLERLVQLFYPVQWDLHGIVYFPGGKLIGSLLMANLLAAHAVRFKVATRGRRLAAGLVVIGLGIITTYLVIRSGMNDTVESELSPYFCNMLWHAMRAVLGVIALAGAYALALGYRRIRRTEWLLLLAVDAIFCVVAAWLFLHPEARLDDAGLRILWQLAKGLAAGLILMAGCALVFRKRSGIVLLHGGVALMMFGELLTGLSAQESQMSIEEGATADYSQDIRTTELAVIDRSSPEHDTVTVVPEPLLEDNVGRATRLDHADLPFTIQVHRWLPNSALRMLAAGQTSPATAGPGQRITAELLPQGTGADDTMDSPSAYVELFAKTTGQSLGTYLVSQQLPEQSVDVNGHAYGLALRFKRIYFPYTLTLKDFRFDRYTGTDIAKNYSSLVELRDPARNVDRQVLIWMNNPLRYAGTTFYQMDFDRRTEQATVLQVVSNAGWMIPYVACMLVLTGMLAHFGIAMVRFSRRASEQASELQLAGQPVSPPRRAGQRGTPMTVARAMAFAFPAVVVILFAGYLLGKTRMPHSAPSEMQIYEFAKLPLAYQGRIKPYDTLARNSLQILSGRQEVIVRQKDGTTTRLPAIRWLLDAISGSDAADSHRVFRIDNLDLLQTLGLEPREGSFRYSVADLRDNFGELENQIELAAAQPEAARSLFQNKVLQLANKLNFYGALTQSFQLPDVQNERLAQQQIASLQGGSVPHAVPPQTVGGRWTTLTEAEFDLWRDRNTNRPRNATTVALATMLMAYAKDDATTFNKELSGYRHLLADYEQRLAANADQLTRSGLAKAEILSQPKINFEAFYNHFSPFYYAAVLYVAAFVLGALAWLGWTTPLRRASIWLLWLTFAVHTFALVGRIYISGRPPVTNLYSSAVFIGWACVLLALVFESIYRLGLGNIVAAVIGFLTLLVAHFLSLDGDTFIVLQAVLDTQFWLATHVVCITLGYSTTFLAGAFGVLYVLLAHVFPVLDEPSRRQLVRMIYGTLCFAIFFSFVGTVLGGLWADDSWGRFWGWDPKENGALIIVLYNALVLHARWGALVKERGLAVLAIGGNIVTTWSWFGVNELNVGLHSYGASERDTAMWLLAFVAAQVVLITLGMMPRWWWRLPSTTGGPSSQ